jgi:hypothetical protein
MPPYFFQPQVIRDNNNTNGGIISPVPIVPYIKNNIFPDVQLSEAGLGIQRVRKVFFTLPFVYSTLWIAARPSTGSDAMCLCVGTPTDTWATAQNYTAWKGAGYLDVDIDAGYTPALLVNSENGFGFSTGDLILCQDSKNMGALRVSYVAWNNFKATLYISPLSFLNEGFSALDTTVSSALEMFNVISGSFWIKEIVPMDAAGMFNNLTEIKFYGVKA